MIFPDDFVKNKTPEEDMCHHWLPKKLINTFVSIIGGGDIKWCKGDGVDTFEIMIEDKSYSWQTKEDINNLLKNIS